MNYKRNSYFVFLKNTISTIKSFISLLVFAVLFSDLDLKNIILIGCVFTVLILIYNILIWRTDVFYIKEDILYNNKGLFIKKEVKIPLKNIATVDFEETFLQRVLKVTTLKIDTFNVSDGQDLNVVLNNKDAIEFKKALIITDNKVLQEQITSEHIKVDEEVLYHLDKKDLLVFSTIKGSFLFMISTLLSLIALISEIGEDNINNFVESITLSTIVLFIISLVLIFILKLVAIAFNYFKYYDFKLKKDNSKIQISYGFFTKKNYTLNLDNLHAIKIKQSIGQIIFKKSTLSISTFGYGDDKTEEAILFPHIDEDNIDDILNGLFPKFVYNGDKHRINKKYKFRYKYARIGYNKDILYLSGGIFKKKISFISIDALDDIYMRQLFFKRNRPYFKLKVHYKSMKSFDLRSIKGIDKSHFDELTKYLLN